MTVDDIWQPNAQGLGLGKVMEYIGIEYQPVHEVKSIKLFEK